MTERSYSSPVAFRSALTARLKTMAKISRWTMTQLQRQFAYDRLLERMYLTDQDWIVKGATALLARDIGVRGSLDIDVYRQAAHEEAEADLRAAAARDIGDWFRFDLGNAQIMENATRGVRIPVTAYVGATQWAKFHVDLVGSDVRMTGVPENVPALARVAMPDVEQHGYRAYPLVDHVADKIAAIFQRYGQTQTPSTRYRDLVDLVAIATSASVPADTQMAALHSELQRRDIPMPGGFQVPDRALWERGYGSAAANSLLPIALTLDEALAVVRPFAEPLLEGSARGIWDPNSRVWRG
ncbi:MAG: nucleotidyl transferase AbiEii/AbiGii toxin family protein [Solirubrobacteraceae bacterium]